MKRMSEKPVKNTYSLCPFCLKRIPAELTFQNGSWYIEKTCAQHGDFRTIIWRGTTPALDSWGNYLPPIESEEDQPDCPRECGLCDKHLQSTCCVLVEVTDRCNLKCPVCFAGSGGEACKAEKSVDDLFKDFCFLIEHNCHFIQLSGGEPTVRDDLPDIVRAAKRSGATTVQLNSNGLRLGEEPAYTKRLAQAGLDFVFLQFDGMDDVVNQSLRGRPALAEKMNAIKACGEFGIGVTLVPTIVPGVNDLQIGDIIRFGMENSPVVRGVHFQPISYFGRYPHPPKDKDRITLPEIIAAIELQTERMICLHELVPSSCDHPRCGFHGDFMILSDRLVPLSPKASDVSPSCCGNDSPFLFSREKNRTEALLNRNFVARRWKRNLELEKNTQPASNDVMDLDTFLKQVAVHGFTITGMAFQDSYNLDLQRLRRCSLHVYEEGRLVPFCSRYLTKA